MSTADLPGRIETLNAVQIYFEDHGSGNEPLFVLHGFSGSSQDWNSSSPQLTERFRVIAPDLRGHGRSGILAAPFRHQDAARDMLALLDLLKIDSCKGIGVSCGGNVLLHMAAIQPERLKAMVLVSATPYFPAQARAIMRQYSQSVTPEQFEQLRANHPGGDEQVRALLASTAAFADSYDDMNFTPPLLATVRARTLIVQGDRDPLYPVDLSVEMAKAIPRSSLWIVPDAGHGPVIGKRWSGFLDTAIEFLNEA